MQKIVMHLVSESSGQTVKHVAKAAISQFQNIKYQYFVWPLINNQQSLDIALKDIKLNPGLVIYTISNPLLRDRLKIFCNDNKIQSISAIGQVVRAISSISKITAEDTNIHVESKFGDDYYDKVNAISYTFRHDDGQNIENIDTADIILIGQSRSTKTPTSVYLAYNGLKTANVPYVNIGNNNYFEHLYKLKNKLIIALIINPLRLLDVRRSRMDSMHVSEATNYIDLNVIQEEHKQLKLICLKQNWPMIDVSHRSIEESAAIVMKLFYEYKRCADYKSDVL